MARGNGLDGSQGTISQLKMQSGSQRDSQVESQTDPEGVPKGDDRSGQAPYQSHFSTLHASSSRPRILSWGVRLIQKPFAEIWQHRDLLFQLTKRSIQGRYRGSAFGFAWSLITPIMMLVVYTFVFSIIFGAKFGTVGQEESSVGFALTLLCGLSMYNIVAETLSNSATVITMNPNYVKKVVFPIEMLPVSALLTALYFSLIWFGILIGGIMLVMGIVSPTMLVFPLMLVPLGLCTCGIAWILASLGVYLRDTTQVLAIVLQMLIFLTPIFYSVKMIPGRLQAFIYLNPLTSIVENTRAVLIERMWPNWLELGLLTAASLVVFCLGHMCFQKSKRGFADVL